MKLILRLFILLLFFLIPNNNLTISLGFKNSCYLLSAASIIYGIYKLKYLNRNSQIFCNQLYNQVQGSINDNTFNTKSPESNNDYIILTIIKRHIKNPKEIELKPFQDFVAGKGFLNNFEVREKIKSYCLITFGFIILIPTLKR